MKKNFTAGLAILLPIVITYWLVMFLVNLLTKPFLGTTANFIQSMGFQGSHDTITWLSQFLILLLLFACILIIGVFGRMFLVEALLSLGDKFVHKIPLINKLYKAIQDVVHSVFHGDNPSFSKVVLVPYPHSDAYALGFITRESMMEPSLDEKGIISVFVPGTPNPSMGFMLSYKRSDMIPLDMDTSKAIKFIVSCGVIYQKNGAKNAA